MIPFFGMGAFQLVDRAVGRLITEDSETFNGDDGAENEFKSLINSCYYSICLFEIIFIFNN